VLDLAFLNQHLHRSRHVLDRHIRVDTVLVEQVDSLDPEPLERALGDLPDALGPKHRHCQDNIVKFAEPGPFEDPLTEVLRCGARKLLTDAIEAEVSDFLGMPAFFATGICPSARS
jgi:hypothetical protein